MKIEIEIINYNENKTDLIKKTINYYATIFKFQRSQIINAEKIKP